MAFQGIAEFPVKFDPVKDWPGVRQALMNMRQDLIDSVGPLTVPRDPKSLTVTAAAFANIIQFVRTNGDRYEVWWSPNQNLMNASPVDIGNSGQWVDYVGNSGVTRYYWVRAINTVGAHSQIYSNFVGPISATTLTVAGAVNPPVAPPAGDQIVKDQTTGLMIQNPAGSQ